MHQSFRGALATIMILGGLLAASPLSVAAAATNEITVVLRYADGSPVGGDRAKGISIFSSKQDANGNPIRDRQVAYGSTGDTGSVRFKDLLDGTYFIESDLGWGYRWDQLDRPIRLSGGAAQSFELKLARVTMSLRNGDGSIAPARGVTIFTTKRDANDAEIAADGVAYASSGDTGRVVFDLTPGRYTFSFDTTGYPWAGLPRPFSAVSGQTFDVQANLGRLRVVLRGTDGSPLNIGVHVSTQQPDANANPVAASQVAYAATGDTGQTSFDLTPGMYWVSYSTPSGQNVAVPNVPVASGQITLYDGSGVHAPPGSSAPNTPPPAPPATPQGCHDGELVRDGAIEHKWCASGGDIGLLGRVTTGERDLANSFGTTGSYAAFANGHIYFSPSFGVFETHGGPDSVYLASGGPGGSLGFPQTDGYDWNGGLRNDFQGGSIGWDGVQYSPLGKVWTFEVNPFESEFYGDPANQLKLLLPTSAPVEMIDNILNSLAAIGLGTDVISSIQNSPPDQVAVNLWYSRLSERCLVEVVRLSQGRVIDSRVDSSEEVSTGCSQSIAQHNSGRDMRGAMSSWT